MREYWDADPANRRGAHELREIVSSWYYVDVLKKDLKKQSAARTSKAALG
jgi:hypothetical protein